jgi:hypothetical protein
VLWCGGVVVCAFLFFLKKDTVQYRATSHLNTSKDGIKPFVEEKVKEKSPLIN